MTYINLTGIQKTASQCVINQSEGIDGCQRGTAMKIHLEIIDDDGFKTSVETENDVKSPKTAAKLIKFMQDAGIPVHHIGGSSSSPYLHSEKDVNESSMTLKERLRLFLKFEFENRWFTSSDVKLGYELNYATDIPLSTVSTYLARLCREGFLVRRGTRKQMEYHLKGQKRNDIATDLSIDHQRTEEQLRD
ncbi:MAG: hypothetical protein SCAL_001707 [Candidatus Syntrophoarchaeum caldarius]|uniref:Uncharacterized protein n=1 Tax=Candidatus Syntropharchaeum caldarium TaxID=1838285 RepID=A0A1F2P7J3_9EURY|nr:MAG: hypothetical protein SCAL_001707 [Candidatus Syntrophoarchaeum caldarius]